MAKKKKRIYFFIFFLLFVIYFLLAARPIPRETILVPGWISSLESEASVVFDKNPYTGQLFPFTLGSRSGYVNSAGKFAINKIINDNIYLGGNMWTEFTAEPSNIEINNTAGETIIKIDNIRGYPVLLDNRVFILGSDQNSLSEISADGKVLWTYEFGAPLICIDAAADLVLTGSLDGIIEILDSSGKRLYYFEPGGSRYNVIYGCAISRNGSRLGIICGIDSQRFLFLERLGGSGEYRIVYHEFLGSGFRRPVRVSFIDEDRRIVFEREGGAGCYNIKSRRSIYIPLDGKITAVDNSGGQGLLFLVTSHSQQRNKLIGIKLPQDRRFSLSGTGEMQDAVFLRALFKSSDVYLERTDTMLIAGGGTSLISFNLEDK